MKRLASHGIILRRLDYGEADRIITFLTADFGKTRAIAKGVRKQKSKMAGGIELFSVSELHFIKGRGDIDTLVSTRLDKYYGNIVKDLKRTQLGYGVLKSLDRTLEDETGSEYFELLQDTLDALNNTKIELLLIELSFSMRLLYGLGHVPDFRVNASGTKLDPDVNYEFDYDKTTFVPNSSGIFNKNHLKVLRLLTSNSAVTMTAVQGINGYTVELTPLIRSLASQYIPK